MKAAGRRHDSAARKGGETPNDVITGGGGEGGPLTHSQSGFTLEMRPERASLLMTAHEEGILVLQSRTRNRGHKNSAAH